MIWPMLPITIASLPTTQKHFDWVGVSSRCLLYLPAAILEDQGRPLTWRLYTRLWLDGLLGSNQEKSGPATCTLKE